MGRTTQRTSRLFAGVVLGLAVLASACSEEKGEDRPNVEVIGQEGSVSISGFEGGSTSAPLYVPVGNQDLNLGVGADLRDMRALMGLAATDQPVDWAAVTAIYTNGKNQVRPDGTVRSSASLVTPAAIAVFPDAAQVYGSATFIDQTIRDGLAGTGRAAGLSDNSRRQIVDEGMQVLMYAKVMEGLAAAKPLVASGGVEASAPIDAGWAMMAGIADSNLNRNNGLLATALTREEDFGAQGVLLGPMQARLSDAAAAAQLKDTVLFDRSSATARGFLNSVFYLGTLRAVNLLATDQQASIRELHLAQGWTYYQAIRATVASASASGAQELETLLSRDAATEFSAADATRAYSILNNPAVISALGIPATLQVRSPGANAGASPAASATTTSSP